MIERAEVDRAFELCLRRPVGSVEAYAFFASLETLDAVYATLFDSPEFHGRLVPAPDDKAAARQVVEVTAAPDVLAQMVAHVEATWTQLGESEPHWSVITDPRFKASSIEANREMFRHFGRYDDVQLGQALVRAGVDGSRLQTCLEFGCGTGRMTEFLAQRFPEVIAADISVAHLATARASLPDATNITFLHLARAALEQLPPYDMLYSRIVLQHNPPPVIAVILRRLLAGLSPGGVAYLQVPVWLPGYQFRVSDYLAGLRTGPMEMHALPQPDLLAIMREAGCCLLELREDALGPQFGGISNTVVLQKAS